MFKRLINIITLILIVILVVIVVLGVLNFTKLSHVTVNDSKFDRLHPPKYRFMVIMDGTDSSYVENFNITSRSLHDQQSRMEMNT